MRKFNLIFTVIFLCAGKQDVGGVFWPCESNNDCTAVGSSCKLETGLCECEDFNSVFSDDYTKCLTTSLFGDKCEDTVQCNLMPSGANCKSGVCDCIDDHTFVRGRCRPSNGLGESCETDLDCYFGYDRKSVSCKERVCTCADGYYRRYGNICRRKSMEIDDGCVVDTDCDELGSNVKCNNLKCQYVDEIENGTESPTLKQQQTNKRKRSNTKLIHSEKSVEQTPALTNGDSEFSDDDNNIEIETETATASATASVSGTSLKLKPEIEPETETEAQNRRKSREIAVQTSIESYELKELRRTRNVRNVGTTTAGTGTSNRHVATQQGRRSMLFRLFDDDDIKTYSTLSNTDDDADEKKYGSVCSENGKACAGLPHSVCANKVCLCRQGYYPRNNKCFAELGEIAESNDECEHTFDEISKICICQKNFFYERDLRSCRKPIQYHLSCTSNSQCSPFGAAYCHPEIPRRCTCEEYAEYNELQQMCLYKEGLGSECERDDGCTVANSVCSNRYCVCKTNYFERNGECYPGLGAGCTADTECVADNTVCHEVSTNSGKESEETERTCQCRRGYVHFKDECLKEAEQLNDECNENEQCKPLLATCSDNKCVCSDGQHEKNGRCEAKKVLGEACSKGSECFVEKDPETVECRNSVCQCKFGYQAETENKYCIRVLPSKKNSSGRPSALKIITFVLIGSAFLITSAAIKQAYY